jgi:structure-specific recognition protein 1
VISKTGPEHTFTSINKEEHEVTEVFLRDKKVRVKNEMVPDADLLLAAVVDDDDDEEMSVVSDDSAGKSRKSKSKPAANSGGGDDDSSEEDGGCFFFLFIMLFLSLTRVCCRGLQSLRFRLWIALRLGL